LLHRRQSAVDDDEADFFLGDGFAKSFDPALAEQRRRNRPAEANDLAGDDIEVDRLGEADRLVEPGVERARGAVARLVAGRGLQGGMNDKGAAGGRGGIMLGERQG
jgi:hypothetical protein